MHTTKIEYIGYQKGLSSLYSALFYHLLNGLSDITIPRSTTDFKLLDRVVVDHLKGLKEYHLFLRGLIPWLGFKQKGVIIQTAERTHGKSTLSPTKLVQLALHAFTSFSITPLRWATGLGLLFAGLAFGYGGYAVYIYFFTGQAVAGWTSVIASILLLSGVQLIIMGIIGEYVGKIFEQVKQRPGYIISNTEPAFNINGKQAAQEISDSKYKPNNNFLEFRKHN